MSTKFLIVYMVVCFTLLTLISLALISERKLTENYEKKKIQSIFNQGYNQAMDTVFKILQKHYLEDTVSGHKRVTKLVINDTVAFYLSSKTK